MKSYEHVRTQEPAPTYQKYVVQNNPPQSRIRTYPHIYESSNSITPASKSSSTKSTNNSNAYYIYDEGYDRKNMKKMLYEDYQSQLRMKRQRDSLQKIQQIELQKKRLKKTEQIYAQIHLHNYEQKLNKQRELSQDFHHKQQLNKYNKQLELELKSKQRQLFQNQKHINKRALFQQFYMNCEKGMKMNSKMYLDKVVPVEQRRQVQKDKLTQAGINKIADKYNQMYHHLKSQNDKKISQLRNELEQQRQEKQQIRRYNSQQKLQPPNHHINYHDTIINPVNLGINPENKYVVAEIRKNVQKVDFANSAGISPESTMNKKGMSQLAKNGSKVLL